MAAPSPKRPTHSGDDSSRVSGRLCRRTQSTARTRNERQLPPWLIKGAPAGQTVFRRRIEPMELILESPPRAAVTVEAEFSDDGDDDDELDVNVDSHLAPSQTCDCAGRLAENPHLHPENLPPVEKPPPATLAQMYATGRISVHEFLAAFYGHGTHLPPTTPEVRAALVAARSTFKGRPRANQCDTHQFLASLVTEHHCRAGIWFLFALQEPTVAAAASIALALPWLWPTIVAAVISRGRFSHPSDSVIRCFNQISHFEKVISHNQRSFSAKPHNSS